MMMLLFWLRRSTHAPWFILTGCLGKGSDYGYALLTFVFFLYFFQA